MKEKVSWDPKGCSGMFFGVRAALCKHTVSPPHTHTHTEQAPIPNISMEYFPSPKHKPSHY